MALTPEQLQEMAYRATHGQANATDTDLLMLEVGRYRKALEAIDQEIEVYLEDISYIHIRDIIRAALAGRLTDGHDA